MLVFHFSMRFGKLSRLVCIAASCLAISTSVFAERGKVIEEPVYPGSILKPKQQTEVVELYHAYLVNSDEKEAMLINLSDKVNVGVKDKFVSEEEKRAIAEEMAQFMIYEAEKEIGKSPDKIYLDLYMQRKIAENPRLAIDKLIRAVYDYAFNQLEYRGLRSKNW